MHDYELVIILKPETDEVGVASTLERLASFVNDRGGSIASQELWGVRRLAYPIRKFKEGNYVLTHFKLQPQFTRELDNYLNVTDEIIRHLLTRGEIARVNSSVTENGKGDNTNGGTE
ncbi:MAG: 30S ribosomal protein S6 [Chloroflexi bacterium]|nr:30S ribosomal protein S6 [Chloroflexota bacterium]